MRWTTKPFSAALAAHLSKELGLYRIVAAVLTQRGVTDVESARRFINPSLETEWSDPESIMGMREVADGVERALRANKRIVVFGDYDVDGITASAIMFNTLEALGSKPQVVLPLREGEGYGLSEPAIERICALNPEVLITVDCGIAAAEEIKLLLEKGIEVFVTDHHEVPGASPLTVPAADPKRTPHSPAAMLSGAGVALKLADLLGRRFGKPDLWKTQLDLAALGTIADSMPLGGENRALVSAGVKALNAHPRPGLIAVQEVSGRTTTELSSEDLSYGLIPRLNAAGRVSDALIAFDLLCAQEHNKTHSLAKKLEELNSERKALESGLMAKAVKQIEPFKQGSKSLVVGGEQWHEGVRGIVASRLVHQYGVPAIVLSFEDDLAIGSGRSVGNINLYAALQEASDLLVKFGGHEAAVGVTINQKNLKEFSRRLEAFMQRQAPEQFTTTEEIDCEISFEHLSLEAVSELSMLEPYGRENPEPRFLTTGLLIKEARFVGAGERHLSFTLTDGTRELPAIWFSAPYRSLEDLPAIADAVYHARIDEWRGKRKLKLYIQDILTEPTEAVLDNETEKDLGELLLFGTRDKLNSYIAHGVSGRKVELRKSQLKCLETLDRQQSTLAIMATGRGKSLIFHTHAASLALRKSKPSLFIYPLRSLISDQEYFLARNLGSLGLSCASLTGSTPRLERDRIYQDVKDGALNIVLTTPEYVLANAGKTNFWSEFEFTVIDEAHHIATSGRDFRPDYTRLEQLRTLMPRAVFLGLSATSDKPTTDAIVKSLAIEQIIVDTSKRPNLLLDDKRDVTKRDDELAQIIAASSRALVYVNSRTGSIDLCRALRRELPEKAPRIAFYNAALEVDDRLKVEEAFRSGALDCLVATSAFGEGVNIPDVRDVVLYDLPYSLIDFNQMSGRAGRDGKEAHIHILMQRSESNELLLHLQAKADSLQGSVEERAALDEQRASIRELQFFADWLFAASPFELLSIIQKPLTPLKASEE
ncbi:MAG: single-stranded-DNA-specific exonuclease RecJ [Coriobacteriia bacterium]|nr:single-stranded-DNA-specific exonuclease RecJ [Coriobacteriia bacterium]MCL2749416.1 single-stranded-DNA-specific exonuclease RecJ [Coriobacteriia bacterium]